MTCRLIIFAFIAYSVVFWICQCNHVHGNSVIIQFTQLLISQFFDANFISAHILVTFTWAKHEQKSNIYHHKDNNIQWTMV